jgi:hypothetical protein
LVAIRNSRPSRQAGDALPASGGDASISRQDKVAFAKLYSSLENIHYFGFVLPSIQLTLVDTACCNQRTPCPRPHQLQISDRRIAASSRSLFAGAGRGAVRSDFALAGQS